MINIVSFRIEERMNVYRKSGREFALKIVIDGKVYGTVKAWGKKPADSTIQDVIDVVTQSFYFCTKAIITSMYDFRYVGFEREERCKVT